MKKLLKHSYSRGTKRSRSPDFAAKRSGSKPITWTLGHTIQETKYKGNWWCLIQAQIELGKLESISSSLGLGVIGESGVQREDTQQHHSLQTQRWNSIEILTMELVSKHSNFESVNMFYVNLDSKSTQSISHLKDDIILCKSDHQQPHNAQFMWPLKSVSKTHKNKTLENTLL